MDDPPPRMAVIMKSCSLAHASDADVMQGLLSLVKQDRVTTAEMLAHLSEVDARRLYLPAAYASMYEYCVGELHMSEDMALKRIQAARVARRFPMAFALLADGRLHLSGLVLLAPHLTAENHADLLAEASHRTKAGIEALLAERFPRPDVFTSVTGLAPVACATQHAPGQVAAMPVGPVATCAAPEHAPGQVRRRSHCDEVIPWLRSLGPRAEEARRGAAMCEDMPDAPLDQRVRFALAGLGRARYERGLRAACPGS